MAKTPKTKPRMTLAGPGTGLLPGERILLTPDEAARAIGVSRSKLYRLIKAGLLEAVIVGKVIRVPVDSLRALGQTA